MPSPRLAPAVAIAVAVVMALAGGAAITASSQSQGSQAAGRPPSEAEQAIALCDSAEKQVDKAQYRDARESALRCLEIAEKFAHPSGIGRANLLLGVSAEFSGDYAEARSRATLAIEAFESAGESSPGGRRQTRRYGTAARARDRRCAHIRQARDRSQRLSFLGRRALQPGALRVSVRETRSRSRPV